ncbi:hypothetical protein OESDEN_16631 [Oesophagostomum dentatum]|uniref:Uncharacterized protein n=1 Tax=Oesophagostomum dentatum TaxID=61180 RepID=A0A0B1SEG2_OESDE|nr:hypothetical protein OESDEN_16631 [Oesophagostomum dentatum]
MFGYGLYGTHDFFDDHGKELGGHEHYDNHNKGFVKGFDEGSHGEYDSYKYSGWGKHAKGEEHGKYYGTEYDDGHEKGRHDYGYDHTKIGPIHEHIYAPHVHHGNGHYAKVVPP